MEKELIRKIKELKKVEPSKEWVVSVREELILKAGLIDLSENSAERRDVSLSESFFGWAKFFRTGSLMACLVIVFIIGPWLAIEASQESLPGEKLYSVKKATEKIQTGITSGESKTQLEVDFASRRLMELSKMTENPAVSENKTKRVGQIIDDFKDNLSDANHHLENVSDKISKEEAIAVAKKTKRLKKDISKAKEDALLVVEEELAEAEKIVKEIDSKILGVLVRVSQESASETSTSTDKEILIFLEENKEKQADEEQIQENLKDLDGQEKVEHPDLEVPLDN